MTQHQSGSGDRRAVSARSEHLRRRLARYSATAGAVVAAGAASSADADIMATMFAGGAQVPTGGSLGIDFDDNGFDEFVLEHHASAFYSSYSIKLQPGSDAVDQSFIANRSTDPYPSIEEPSPLAAGSRVGPALASGTWNVNTTYAGTVYGYPVPNGTLLGIYSGTQNRGQFVDGSVRHVGVRFKFPGLEDDFQYGWVQLSVDPFDATTTVFGYAYETTRGVGIDAGQTETIPEPTGLALLAVGAAGVLTRRRPSR